MRSHGPEIRSADWIRQRYYQKLNIDPPNLEKQETVSKDGASMDIFAPKSAEEIRNRYINKLIQMGIMKEGPSKKYQHRNSSLSSVFIFDWDDTLLCTSYLSALHFVDLTPEIKQVLTRLDEMVIKLLELTLQRGEVFIITNATEGWVQYSSKLYFCINSVICPRLIQSSTLRRSRSFLLGLDMESNSLVTMGAGKLKPSRVSFNR